MHLMIIHILNLYNHINIKIYYIIIYIMSLLKLYYKDLNNENSSDNIDNIPKKYNKNLRYYYNSLDNNINVQKKKRICS